MQYQQIRRMKVDQFIKIQGQYWLPLYLHTVPLAELSATVLCIVPSAELFASISCMCVNLMKNSMGSLAYLTPSGCHEKGLHDVDILVIG